MAVRGRREPVSRPPTPPPPLRVRQRMAPGRPLQTWPHRQSSTNIETGPAVGPVTPTSGEAAVRATAFRSDVGLAGLDPAIRIPIAQKPSFGAALRSAGEVMSRSAEPYRVRSLPTRTCPP